MTRPTWVFVAGPYRSGSTTQHNITREVVMNSGFGIDVGYHTEGKLKDFDGLDFSDIEAVKEIYSRHKIECPFDEPPQFNRQSPYIVCKVFEFLPNGFDGSISHGELIARQKRLRAVVTIRDPRDIILSMKKRADPQKFDFKETATKGLPIWLANLERWIDLGPELCYQARFEKFTVELNTDGLHHLEPGRIAAFLGIDLSQEQLTTIGKNYTIKAQQERKERLKRGELGQREDTSLPSRPAVIFGTSGHWRTWLTPDEAALVVEANRAFFERFGYEVE